jgi:hypothetical protein
VNVYLGLSRYEVAPLSIWILYALWAFLLLFVNFGFLIFNVANGKTGMLPCPNRSATCWLIRSLLQAWAVTVEWTKKVRLCVTLTVRPYPEYKYDYVFRRSLVSRGPRKLQLYTYNKKAELF